MFVHVHVPALKAKRNKGMKNAGHGLNRGCRYWCHASDSLTEPSGPAASQWAHIPISLRYESKFSQDCHQAIPSHSRFSHLDSHWERHSNSGVHGSSHGRHFSSLCFSLLSMHICTRTHSFSFKYMYLMEPLFKEALYTKDTQVLLEHRGVDVCRLFLVFG